MGQRNMALAGSLLGLAVGDAMGYSVDKLCWNEIMEAYGPGGLMGFDLTHGSADVTSYTQLAVFTANAMLLAITRGKEDGFSRSLLLAAREWYKSQLFRSNPDKTRCWVAQVSCLRRRLCMDTQMLDALSRDTLGTPERPVFKSLTPGSLTAAVGVGLCYDPRRLTEGQLMRLGAEAVAFTHGKPEVYIAGAYLALTTARLLQEPEKPFCAVFTEALDTVCARYADIFPQDADAFAAVIRQALALTREAELTPQEAMMALDCATAAQCVAGAVYAATIHPANFDEAMIVSVNHSGHSSAVGALCGAMLGARLGADALPDFYLESLECAPYLRELAQDLMDCRQVSRIFDDDWDQKYVQGLPTQ